MLMHTASALRGPRCSVSRLLQGSETVDGVNMQVEDRDFNSTISRYPFLPLAEMCRRA